MVAIAHNHTEMHKDIVSCSPSAGPRRPVLLRVKSDISFIFTAPPTLHTTRHTRENYNVDHKKNLQFHCVLNELSLRSVLWVCSTKCITLSSSFLHPTTSSLSVLGLRVYRGSLTSLWVITWPLNSASTPVCTSWAPQFTTAHCLWLYVSSKCRVIICIITDCLHYLTLDKMLFSNHYLYTETVTLFTVHFEWKTLDTTPRPLNLKLVCREASVMSPKGASSVMVMFVFSVVLCVFYGWVIMFFKGLSREEQCRSA